MDHKVILCVGDEEIILKSLESQLRSEFGSEFLYEFAQDADNAFEILEELDAEGHQILVIVSDWLMPGIKGDEFLIKAHQKFPHVVKVMLTGQADEDAIENAKKHANLHRCLHKPWDVKDLIETIRTGLAKL